MDRPSGSIEHIVQQALSELGIANPVFRSQTFLLRDRQLVGRRFCFEGVEAVWLSAEGQIRFCNDQGELLQVLDVGQVDSKRAA